MENEEDGHGQEPEQDRTQGPKEGTPQASEQKQEQVPGTGSGTGIELGPEVEEEGSFRSAEVAAFFGMMNYFRQEIRVRNAADTEWRNWHWYAGDRIVQDALDGKKTIGLRASLTTSFIGFDIDVPGKIEEANAGNERTEGWREEEGGAGDGGDGEPGKAAGREPEVVAGVGGEGSRKSGDVVRTWVFNDKRSDEEKEADRAREERMQAGIAAWAGWNELKELSGGKGDYFEELGRAMAEVVEIKVPGRKPTSGAGPITMELSLELREAAEIVKGCFTVEPSLAVKSPHGCHLYWLLSEMKYWTVVKDVAQRVKEEAEDQYAEIGIERNIEVLPSPTQALRLPRKDRLLKAGSLEALEEIKDGEAFWKGLKQYRLEEIVKEEVLERELGEHRRKPYRGPKRRKKKGPDEEKTEEEKEELRQRASGKWEGSGTGAQEGCQGTEGAVGAGEHDASGGSGGRRDGDDYDGDDSDAGEGDHDGETKHGWRRSKKPKNKEEAEEMVMPFRNGETNRQLILMVEGAKRSGMSLAEIIEWVKGWIERSKDEGYTGDLGNDERNLESRIDRLYARCNVSAGGKKRWIELWESENGKYARDEERAKRMMEELERVRPLVKQSRPAVLRFMGDLEAWRRIIDDEAGRAPSRLDKLTIENQKRGAYPLPHQLLDKLYSRYRDIWEEVQRAGVLAKDSGKGGGYVPNLGRAQSYIFSSIVKM